MIPDDPDEDEDWEDIPIEELIWLTSKKNQ